MAIPPMRLNCVRSDQLNLFQIVPPRDSAVGFRGPVRVKEERLSRTGCARTEVTQLLKGVGAFVSVVPYQLELIRTDLLDALRFHGSFPRPPAVSRVPGLWRACQGVREARSGKPQR